jgi:hypothetical protein
MARTQGSTSVATIGDTTPPVLSIVNLSPTSTTTAGTVNVSANCTTTTQSEGSLPRSRMRLPQHRGRAR